jgi:hypothetical protein
MQLHLLTHWNPLLKVEEIEKLALIDCLPAHHDPPPSEASNRRNHDSPWISNSFFNSIGQTEKHSA